MRLVLSSVRVKSQATLRVSVSVDDLFTPVES